MVLPSYAKSVAKIMATRSTPEPHCIPTRLNSNPFVDDTTMKCNEVHRGSEDDEGMENNMGSHGASTQDSILRTSNAFIVYFGFDVMFLSSQ